MISSRSIIPTLEKSLPTSLAFYGDGILRKSYGSASSNDFDLNDFEEDALYLGFQFHAFDENGISEQAQVIVRFDSVVDDGTFQELGNILVSQLATNFQRNSETPSHTMISPPQSMDFHNVQKTVRGQNLLHQNYLYLDGQLTLPVDIFIMPYEIKGEA